MILTPFEKDFHCRIGMRLEPKFAAWAKIGYNGDVDTASEDVWPGGGIYPLLSGATQLQCISSSTDDDGNPVGSGARTVTVRYLDTNYAEKSTTVTLDGTTAADLSVADTFRIQAFRVTTVGAGNAAAGTIDLRTKVGATVVGRIAPGLTRARTCVYTVPAGKVLYVTSMALGAGAAAAGKNVTITLRAGYEDLSDTVLSAGFFQPYAEVQVEDGSFVREFEVPLRFPATTIVKMSAISGANDAIVTASLRGFVETL
jgi:hypothetical protein